ncbi:Allantoicase-domain-containing protein [Pluteus cervinus]|uniref:Allantoicase-domain-containing protein n=1 Tax=Pluteus cervinus TaxID=181527 RepID=A0ACD3B7E7_9AGAR|nr:Allantoicase-domain-containing protein [Pluteus cervinus]
MYPDGGIARFRVYGHVAPVMPADPFESFDLAHVFAGGRVVFTSDQHFGVGSNLILPGRGKDMGDGWETKRSRQKDHKDWAILQLAAEGFLEYVEIDTAHFKGNFPESCEIHALSSKAELDWKNTTDDLSWTLVLPRTKLGPHRQHYFQLENIEGRSYSHIRVTIHPDGGIKRVRVFGLRANPPERGVVANGDPLTSRSELPPSSIPPSTSMTSPSKATYLPVLPLTPEAFAPFGQVIQAYSDHTAAPKGIRITPANAGTASKFHKLSLLHSSYPVDAGATAGLSVYRCQPAKLEADGTVALTTLERHPFTNQAFIPMGVGAGEGLGEPGDRYLVVVAHNGADDKPDLQTVRAFSATSAQGIMYNQALWHQPMTVLNKPIDFTCVETQIGDGTIRDCEIVSVTDGGSTLFLRL